MKKYEKTEGGLFEQDYVSYCVETPEHNWSVMRRYNDFVWLRDGLEKLHPGMPVRDDVMVGAAHSQKRSF